MAVTTPCPCCTGAHEGEPFDLCEVCIEASLAGVYPHPCRRTWTDEDMRRLAGIEAS